MKAFIYLLNIYLLTLLVAYSQSNRKPDVIIKKDNTKIEAIIQEIDDTIIKYRKRSDPQGPLFNLNKKEVVSILYGNGEVENIVSVANSTKNTATDKPKITKPSTNETDLVTITPPKNTSKGWIGYVSGAYAINKHHGFNIHGLVGYKINDRLGFGLGVGYTGFEKNLSSEEEWADAFKNIPGLYGSLLATYQSAFPKSNYTYINSNILESLYTSDVGDRFEWTVITNLIVRIPKTSRKSGLYLFGGPGIIYGINEASFALRSVAAATASRLGFENIRYNYYKGVGLAVELGALYQFGPIGVRFSTQLNSLNKMGNHFMGVGATIMLGKSGKARNLETTHSNPQIKF